ncbi:hypothetical protein BC332_00288 [Capsicum chinense]|nr:hypothetical protein BC332_00288 [Capsicum chinense]
MRSRWEDVAHKIGQVMGAFPKNFEISVSRLIKLWIAAEFVKCTPEKDFEEVAEGYLRGLIDRSLIMVKKRTAGGKVKTCEVHDLLHDLIIRESRKDRSIHFTKSNVIVSPSAASFEYNIIFNFHKASLTHLWHVYDKHSLPRASSFLCFGRDGTPGSCYQIDPFISFTNFVFSTVLDTCFQPFDHLPSEIWKLYSLRYLALASFDVLPPSVRYLSCLQTLIRYSQQSIICLPAAIWNIRKLRHLYFRKCCYFCDELEDYVGWIRSFDLALTKLQTLSYITFGSVNPWILQQCDVFSPTLKKLTLRGCQLPWSQMKILCKLPKLEVLKLKYYAFRGSEWEPTDERFQQLKFLLLDGTDLIHWKASSIQFPKLESLVLKNCYSLYEIPDDVAEIPTLQFIELYNCSSTADDSANRIPEEQLSLGNDDLVVWHLSLTETQKLTHEVRIVQVHISRLPLCFPTNAGLFATLLYAQGPTGAWTGRPNGDEPGSNTMLMNTIERVKGQVESLHRELSLMKAFLKVSREKRKFMTRSSIVSCIMIAAENYWRFGPLPVAAASARIIQQEKQERDVKDNVFKLVIYPPDI